MSKNSFGIIGMGVMGSSLALNMLENKISLSVYNRMAEGEEDVIPNFLKETQENAPVSGFTEIQEFVESMEQPRKILLMVSAGKVVDIVSNQLLPYLDKDDIIIDGGNSFFEDTVRREKHYKEKGISFVGMGVSGGEEGARRGPSMMVGGTNETYEIIGKYLEKIAAKDDFGSVCCAHVGRGGSGHFVKMLHNGIEYAEMQLIAEVYQLLKDSYSKEDIKQLLSSWQAKEHSSFLLEATIGIMTHKTEGKYTLDLILDEAANKGTGSWSAKTALDLGQSGTMISSAVQARYDSSQKEERVKFANRSTRKQVKNYSVDLVQLEKAYHFARLMNHHQGFEVIRTASEKYDWNINLSELSRIWTNGCILRSDLMKEFVENFKTMTSVLENPTYFQYADENLNHATDIVSDGLKSHVATPCFYAAQNYWLTLTTERLSANMIQAQRDFFGAHTYNRIDHPKGQSFHTNWEEHA